MLPGSMRRLLLAAAALALALPTAARAQDTPEGVAQRFLETVRARDWSANAALIYSADLDSLKAAFVEVSHVDTSSAGLRAIFQVNRVAELESMPAAEVYRRFVTDRTAQTAERERAEVLASTRFQVLGHVPEGDTAYVVYRVTATVPTGPASQVNMMTVRRERGVWKAPLSEEMQALIPRLHTAAAQQRELLRQLAHPAPPAPPIVPPRP
jgi:hypothetical protein